MNKLFVKAQCLEAIDVYGTDSRLMLAIEEMAELSNAIAKKVRGRAKDEDVITEIADVRIMMQQLSIIFGEQDVENEMQRKAVRLHDRMLDYKNSGGATGW